MRLILKARLDCYSGYGQHACQIIRDFDSFGHDINVLPFSIDEYYKRILPDITRNVVHKEQPEEWQFLLSPPNIEPSPNKLNTIFTMWETTRLLPDGFKNLGQSEVIITPSQWGADCFSAQGLTAPIYVVPLGINPDLFHYRPPLDGPCVFGAAGNSVISGRSRKGLNDVIDAFQVAFGDGEDVELRIKTLPGPDAVKSVDDPRIHYEIRYLDDEKMAEWYSGLTCFVSASRGEGWGLMQHQAMATGRPVIGAIWAGLSEFMDERNSYGVPFRHTRATGRYEGCGHWIEPDAWAMVEQMRRVYEDRDEAMNKGIIAAATAHRFTWEKSNRKLEVVLKEVGIL